MTDKFDIIEYLSGMTQFTFDKAVLKRIALERGVYEVTEFAEIDKKTRDLMFADLLYAAYVSPNVWASSTKTHGSYTNTVGSQTIYVEEKERLYDLFKGIYKKYDDEMLEVVEELSGTLQWIDC